MSDALEPDLLHRARGGRHQRLPARSPPTPNRCLPRDR